jgi:hemoglobin/transferrin/lactoferrin receptor protein
LFNAHVAVLLWPAFIALLAGPADAGASSEGPVELDPIVVVASKTPRPASRVAGQVTVIGATEIESFLVEDLDDLLRYEPGLNVESSGTRFGVNGVNIRGIGGNRVAIEVDGVPLRDRFAIGNYSDGGRALVETDRVKRLEVLYGPASTLYGSDALGGVMAFTTWNPDDLLSRVDGNRYFSLRGAYRGTDDSSVWSGTAAWGNSRTGVLFTTTWRDGHELDNRAVPGAPRDLQDWRSRDYQFRVTRDTGSGHRLQFTVEDFERDAVTRLTSILGFERFRNTTALEGQDHDESRRFGIAYEFTGKFWDQGILRVFGSEASTGQLSLEERAAARTPVRLQRYFEYASDLDGLELNLFRQFTRGGS